MTARSNSCFSSSETYLFWMWQSKCQGDTSNPCCFIRRQRHLGFGIFSGNHCPGQWLLWKLSLLVILYSGAAASRGVFSKHGPSWVRISWDEEIRRGGLLGAFLCVVLDLVMSCYLFHSSSCRISKVLIAGRFAISCISCRHGVSKSS